MDPKILRKRGAMSIVLQFFENGERKFVHTMDIQELALKRLSDLQVKPAKTATQKMKDRLFHKLKKVSLFHKLIFI